MEFLALAYVQIGKKIMAYLDIDNLYKAREILLFKRCYALEKIHGTSAHIRWKDNAIQFFSGGINRDNFIALFDQEKLRTGFENIGLSDITIFGEAYGGKCQGMSATYGKDLRFVAFEVRAGNCWLNVPNARDFATKLNLDFVPYREISTELTEIDTERDSDSVQAVKCGMGEGKMREGIVLHPLIELTMNNGARIIAKHKREDFRETKTPRPLDGNKLKILTDAQAIADEWVTEMRLTHILDGFPDAGIEKTGDIIKAMITDIEREALGEIVSGPEVRKAICRKAALMFKNRIRNLT